MSSVDSPSLELSSQAAAEHRVASAAIVVAAVMPWLLPFDVVLQLACSVFAISVIVLAARQAGLIGTRRRIVRAVWHGDGTWRLVDTQGVGWSARLDADSRVLPGFIWLHWRSDRGARQMFLWRGAMPTDTSRKLATRLRLRPSLARAPVEPALESES